MQDYQNFKKRLLAPFGLQEDPHPLTVRAVENAIDLYQWRYNTLYIPDLGIPFQEDPAYARLKPIVEKYLKETEMETVKQDQGEPSPTLSASKANWEQQIFPGLVNELNLALNGFGIQFKQSDIPGVLEQDMENSSHISMLSPEFRYTPEQGIVTRSNGTQPFAHFESMKEYVKWMMKTDELVKAFYNQHISNMNGGVDAMKTLVMQNPRFFRYMDEEWWAEEFLQEVIYRYPLILPERIPAGRRNRGLFDRALQAFIEGEADMGDLKAFMDDGIEQYLTKEMYDMALDAGVPLDRYISKDKFIGLYHCESLKGNMIPVIGYDILQRRPIVHPNESRYSDCRFQLSYSRLVFTKGTAYVFMSAEEAAAILSMQRGTHRFSLAFTDEDYVIDWLDVNVCMAGNRHFIICGARGFQAQVFECTEKVPSLNSNLFYSLHEYIHEEGKEQFRYHEDDTVALSLPWLSSAQDSGHL